MAAGAAPAAGGGERGAGPRGRWVRARERERGRGREWGRGGQCSRRGQPARAGGARGRDGAQPAGFARAARRVGREPAMQRWGLDLGVQKPRGAKPPARRGRGQAEGDGETGHFRLSPAGHARCRRNSTEGPVRLPSPNLGQGGFCYVEDQAKGAISIDI